MRIISYTAPTPLVASMFWYHKIECHYCGEKFYVDLTGRDDTPGAKVKCPKCFTVDDLRPMCDRWFHECKREVLQ